jgi:hypothetical protein
MVDLSLLQSLSYVVAAIGVCIVAVYYVMVFKEYVRNTCVELLR